MVKNMLSFFGLFFRMFLDFEVACMAFLFTVIANEFPELLYDDTETYGMLLLAAAVRVTRGRSSCYSRPQFALLVAAIRVTRGRE